VREINEIRQYFGEIGENTSTRPSLGEPAAAVFHFSHDVNHGTSGLHVVFEDLPGSRCLDDTATEGYDPVIHIVREINEIRQYFGEIGENTSTRPSLGEPAVHQCS
jgi:hypothetical protein